MSYPPAPRSSGPQPDEPFPGAAPPPTQPLPPAVTPPSQEPPAAFGATPAPHRPPVTRLVVRAGAYWGGVVATALVAALVGVVGVLVVQEILDIDLLVEGPFADQETYVAFALGGAICAIAAGALLHVLALTTPRPRAFFGWIVMLATLVAALLPLTWDGDLDSQVATGVVHLVVGIAIWSLLASVLERTSSWETV